ncbi:MAG TPA: sigma-70 family RNA polymerase sigma factor [Ktedonobacterales bacterium]|nr:sigma-70 family RNA polymerase sigma factor [Ktedonobacterales bacterium]
MRQPARWSWQLGESVARARDGASSGETPNTPDNSDLVQFSALLDGSAATITRIAAALIGSADAEDAAQEAILRAWRAWPGLRDRESARAWLTSITVNVCRDWLRGRFGARLRQTESLAEVRIEPRALAWLDADPGDSDHATALDLRAAINTLDEDLRLVVALRYYAGMDSSAIGAALGVPAATARTRLRRALGLLRERLSEAGDPARRPRTLSSDSTEGRR